MEGHSSIVIIITPKAARKVQENGVKWSNYLTPPLPPDWYTFSPWPIKMPPSTARTKSHTWNRFQVTSHGNSKLCIPKLSWSDFNSLWRHPLFYTVTIHPHMITLSDKDPSYFIDLYHKGPKHVEVGELDLNYSTQCKCLHHKEKPQLQVRCTKNKLKAQESFLAEILPLLKPIDTTTVIHTGEGAAKDMMQYLHKAQLFNHRIHWHCFLGDQHLADNLLKEFPNLKISIVPRFWIIAIYKKQSPRSLSTT